MNIEQAPTDNRTTKGGEGPNETILEYIYCKKEKEKNDCNFIIRHIMYIMKTYFLW